MAEIVRSSLNVEENQAREALMLDEKVTRCFVSATTQKNVSAPTLFRSFVSRRHESYACTIVEAARATTAEDPYFPAIDIGGDLKETFIHAGLRWSNPVKSVLEEAVSVYPDHRISCVLSLGTGKQGITGFETSTAKELVKVLRMVANDSEPVSEEVAKLLSENKVFYCRLNVDEGLQHIGFEQWEKLGSVKTHTEKYLQKFDVVQKMDRFVELLYLRSVIASTVERTLGGLGVFLDGLGLPWQGWSTIISDFVPAIQQPSQEVAEMLNIQCALLRDSLASCLRDRNFAQLPEELKASIERLLGRLKRTFENRFNDDSITKINKSFQKFLQLFWIENHIAGNIVVHDILKYLQKNDSAKKDFTRFEQHALNQNLQNLNVAPSAAYNSYEISQRVSCFTGTRVKLLNEIASWITSDARSVPPIYILDGVAGIGKSTIAKTIAENAAEINALGASFFFSRDEEKRKTAKSFFPSTAYQLAYYNADFANRIDKALRGTPHAVTQSLANQFMTMILDPLKDCFAIGGPILILVDALDECEEGGDVLLKILADAIKYLPRLKVFITTRPEHHIRTILDRYQHLRRFHLQDIETSVVQSDIRLYLDFHLSASQVREALPDLKRPWTPTKKGMEMLIGISGTLFIIAATATKFILDSKRTDPAKQLSRLLNGVSPQNFSGSKYTTVMDSFYTQILLSAVPDEFFDEEEEDDWFTRYQLVVGSIVMLQTTLPCQSLSALLDLAPEDVISALSHLHSLVAPSGEDMIFRIHHKSFPDFVTSASRCRAAPKFLIDPTSHHLRLGKQCLKVMFSFLRPNMCGLRLSDFFRDHNETQDLVQNRISQEVVYASLHWSTHLTAVDGEVEQLLEQFAQNYLLVWLEVLSIIQQIDSAYSSLDKILKLLERSKNTRTVAEIFRDGCKFIMLNNHLLKHAGGHVYSSLEFVPQDTRLFRAYKRWDGIKFRVVAGYEKTWDPTLISVMAQHTDSVNFVTFSMDGSKLASTSDDGTVRIWDSQTGGEIIVLRGHSGSVQLVTFFSNGSKLVSAGTDGTIRWWDTHSGSELAVIRKYYPSMALSPDDLRLALAPVNGCIQLWDTETGGEIAICEGHRKAVCAVAFSPGGSKLASASLDSTIRLWNGYTGAKVAVLTHSDLGRAVAFSPDGSKLASVSNNYKVRVWDTENCAVLSHWDWAVSVAFSPDGSRLAIGSYYQGVRLFDCETWKRLNVHQGYDDTVRFVVFSPDGSKIASGSVKTTVQLWDGHTGSEIAVLEGHLDGVSAVAFSPDGSKLASASDDGSVCLWNGQIGDESPLSPSNAVHLLSFSPDGSRFVSASRESALLWDGRTGRQITVLEGHSEVPHVIVFSSNGSKFASASGDKTVRLWDSQTGSEILVIREHSALSLAFSPDGLSIASSSSDGSVRLWDSQSGIKTVDLKCDDAWAIVFSPDGSKLALSTHYDVVIRAFESQTGSEIVLEDHSFPDTESVSQQDGSDPEGQEWNQSTDNETTDSIANPEEDCSANPSGSDEPPNPDGPLNIHGPSIPAEGSSLNAEDGGSEWSTVEEELDIESDQYFGRASSVSFSPDGSKLAAILGGDIVRVWDSRTGCHLTGARDDETDEEHAPVLAAFTSCGSRFIWMDDTGMLHIFDPLFGWTETVRVGVTSCRIATMDSDVVVGLVGRERPSMGGVIVIRFQGGGVLRSTNLCWFPPNLSVVSLAVSVAHSRIVVGCTNGRVLLLEVDFSSL